MAAIVIFSIVFFVIIIAIVTMAVLLTHNMSKTLYMYRNVIYISAILFSVFLLIVLYTYLISCLLSTDRLTIRIILQRIINVPKQFAYLTLPIMGIICVLICISNVWLIKHEGFRLKNLLGVLLSSIFIGGTLAVSYFEAIAHRLIITTQANNRMYDLYMGMHTFFSMLGMLLICYLECFFIGTVVMAYIAVRQKPEYDRDFAIILGCAIDKKGGLLPLLKGRTNKAIHFAWEQEIASGHQMHYVPSGGQGANEIMSEGSAMEMYLLSHGAEDYEVFPEKVSKNTYENFLFSKKIIDSLKENAKVCFVTTNYHMFRSGLIARMVGINAEGIASDTKWYFWPNGFVREFFALMVMKKKQHIKACSVIVLICLLLSISVSFIY